MPAWAGLQKSQWLIFKELKPPITMVGDGCKVFNVFVLRFQLPTTFSIKLWHGSLGKVLYFSLDDTLCFHGFIPYSQYTFLPRRQGTKVL